MFLVRHNFDIPSMGTRLKLCELRGADLIVRRARQEGGVYDETMGLVDGSRVSEWSSIQIVLHGAAGARNFDLSPGQGLATSAYLSEPIRSVGPVSDWLLVAWRNDGPIGSKVAERSIVSLSPSTWNDVQHLARMLAEGEERDAKAALSTALHSLRAEGAPFSTDAGRLPEQAVPPKTGEFARALERSLNLTAQPMAIDLARALGVGERQALRRASEHFSRFHISVSSWREYVAGMRVAVGAIFMGSPRATTDEVSRYLGFASPSGLCHAFQDAGLPSPLALQRALRD